MSLYTRLRARGLFTFGTTIPGLQLYGKPAPYPVVNERAVRAGAGIMLALAIVAITQAWYLGNFIPLQIVVVVFFIEFFMKVLVGTRFAPIGRLGAWVVKKQAPEYVGAVQKRFAWSLGLALATLMIVLLFIFDVRGPINVAICSLCVAFLFLETSFGICVGCKIYQFFLSKGIIAVPEHAPACAGNVCVVE